MTPHRGTLILVLGILSLIICYPLGIVAWVMGNRDMKAIAAGTMDPEGKQLTNIGRILGIIGTVIFLVGAIAVVFFVVLGGAAAALGAGSPPMIHSR
jgi:hypothetical protein